VEESRWVNPHQPQVLFSGVILCYFEGVFALLSYPVLGPPTLLVLVGLIAGGFGTANEKKWGYSLAVGTAAFQVALLVYAGFLGHLGDASVLIAFAFAILLLVLLLHPVSRDYQRIWFK
jgi:hypothetical protein